MIRTRVSTAFVAIVLFTLVGIRPSQAQDDAKSHAQRLIELLKQEKFEDVAKEFNTQVAAAMSAQQLGEAWARIRGQAGDFKSIIDQQVTSQNGYTVVISGCQFDKVNLNAVLAFDNENKIAGLRFVPRPGGARR